MIRYAPAGLRRWRRPLVPSLIMAGVASFIPPLLLPPFAESLLPNAAAIFAGALCWPLLTLLLNGEPLPRRDAFETTTLNPEELVEFVARYSEESAARAQADFWRRSIRELRLGSTMVPLVALAFFSLFPWRLMPASFGWTFFAVFAALSIAMPVILFFVGKRAAAAQARREPDRHVRVTNEGVAVGAATDEALAWRNVLRVWESDAFLTLVLHPLMAIQLPKANMPPEAREIILGATAGASHA